MVVRVDLVMTGAGGAAAGGAVKWDCMAGEEVRKVADGRDWYGVDDTVKSEKVGCERG